MSNVNATGNKAYRGYGGGLYADIGAIITLSSSSWMNNSALDGGAIALESPGPHSIERCNFSYNQAFSRGGGMYLDKTVLRESSFLLLGFKNNSAGSGGGVFWTSESAAFVFNCTNCQLFNNSRYDIATNPVNYTLVQWPETFMSGVALSRSPPAAAYSLSALFNQSVTRVWPQIQMSDVYGQTAVLDNFTMCTLAPLNLSGIRPKASTPQ
ncbi:hypothetical protein THRCLA_20201 [Thraustotheca clavata]|uniref:Right handed beta helix domain-containing protein n=1 Tax=Thraustotheca clavata TaxID=74557 RepID=A0A1W0AA59_9STRA|nr:hypothetical protein THRCLA_20201 [Thraustotheca clavata]